MKVLYYTHYSDFLGANIALVNMIDDLKKRYDVEPIVISRKRGDLDRYLKENQISNYKVAWIPWKLSQRWNHWYIKPLLRFFNTVVIKPYHNALVSYLKPDLIHINSSVTDAGIDFAYKKAIPSIWHLREFGKEDYNLYYMENVETIKNKYELADVHIAVSNSIKEHYEKLISDRKIRVIYDGVDDSKFINRREKGDETLRLCNVGVLTEGKGQLDILRAVSLARKEGYDNIDVFFYGNYNSNYATVLKNYVKNNNMETHIHFMGYTKDIPQRISEMDVGIMSSASEAFGLATVEYMLAELPVIATNSGASPEIVQDNKTGYLYEKGNVSMLKDLIIKFYNNKELIKKMGKEGRRRATELFLRERNTDQIYKTYRELLRSKMQKNIEITL